MLQCVAVRCSALQCVAVCCGALQCVAVFSEHNLVCATSLCCPAMTFLESDFYPDDFESQTRLIPEKMRLRIIGIECLCLGSGFWVLGLGFRV